MALTADQETLWSDIVAIYNNVNAARQKASLNTVSVPTHATAQVPIKSAHVTDLGNALAALNGKVYDTSTGATYSVTIPSVSDLVQINPFTTINSTATSIRNICVHDSGFRSSHRSGFRSHNSGFNSGFRSGHRSHNSSHRGSHRSHDGFGWYSFSANQAN